MTRRLGTLTTAMSLRRAVADLLTDANIGIYADEIVRQQHPPGTDLTDHRVELIESVVLSESNVLARMAEDAVPCLVVRCPEIEAGYTDGEGRTTATAQLEVLVINTSTDQDRENGDYVVSVLASAVAGLLTQNLGSDDGPITSVDWVKTVNAGVTDDAGRAKHAAAVRFTATVADTLVTLAGPLPDLTNPPIGEDAADPGDLAEIDDTDLTTTPVEEIDP